MNRATRIIGASFSRHRFGREPARSYGLVNAPAGFPLCHQLPCEFRQRNLPRPIDEQTQLLTVREAVYDTMFSTQSGNTAPDAQVLDGSVREAVEKVGNEFFTLFTDGANQRRGQPRR